jgi:Fur family ferric uptake transcriptional regulator/Fur family peroxide stress response transcriptional regulator
MNSITAIKKRLLQYGIKPSQQRIALMQYLMESKEHPSADMIYTALSPSMPTLSRTTVYNTLKLLSEQGAIFALNIDGKNVRYDADINTHAHFQCKQCGQVYDLPKKFALFGGRMYLRFFNGLHITESQVYCKGYCKDCMKTINE